MPDVADKDLSGRPTKYKKEYITKARQFFQKAHWDEENQLWRFPSRVWFAEHIGVGLRTVINWEKRYAEFGAVMQECIERSKELRVMFAENNKINSTFAKFVLASAYGMSEKQTAEAGQETDKPFAVNIRIVEG